MSAKDYLLKKYQPDEPMQEIDFGAPAQMQEIDFDQPRAEAPPSASRTPAVLPPAVHEEGASFDTAPRAKSPQPEIPQVTQADLDSSMRKKAVYGGLSEIANNMANGQSFGNYFLKMMNPRVEAGKTFENLSQLEDQKIANKQLLYKQLQEKLAMNKAQRDDRAGAASEKEVIDSQDPNSEANARFAELRASNPILAKSVPEGTTLYQFKQGAPALYDKLIGGEYGLQSAKLKAQAGNGEREKLQQDRADNAAHGKVVANLKKDPALAQRLNQYNNLDNSINNLASNDITPETIHEFQQSVRSNMGIKGGGGVGEREATYMNSLGLHADKWREMMTGDPVAISKDSSMVKHFVNMAKTEQANLQAQKDKRLKALSGGYGSMYGRRPELKADLDELVGSIGDQFQSGVTNQPASWAAGQGHGAGPNQAAPNKPAPGAVVEVSGKRYTVGADGDSLTEIK